VLSNFFGLGSAFTISGSATAELSAQVCFLALSSATDLSFGAGAQVTASNCDIQGNAGITNQGGGSVAAPDFYAARTISTGGSSTFTGRLHPNSGTRADPYASYAPVVSALSKLTSQGGGGSTYSNGVTSLSPGTYSGLTVKNNAVVNLLPGMYYFNGDISLQNSGQLQGSGVTIVTSGQVQFNQQSSATLSAQSGSGSAIPGILFVGNTGGSFSLTSGASANLAGVVYFPNATLSLSGTSGLTASCLKYIVSTANVTAGASVSSQTCAAMGVPSFGPTGSDIMAFVTK
jgi:hypothetical protein